MVTEVTIKCVERHQLVESTSVMTRAEVKANHQSLLQNNKHVRYDIVLPVGLPSDIRAYIVID